MTKSGYELLKDPFLNKGTAFTQEERKAYQLEGLLPPAVETIELQAERVYAEMKKKSSLIEERRFLMDVFNHNRTLFSRASGRAHAHCLRPCHCREY